MHNEILYLQVKEAFEPAELGLNPPKLCYLSKEDITMIFTSYDSC